MESRHNTIALVAGKPAEHVGADVNHLESRASREEIANLRNFLFLQIRFLRLNLNALMFHIQPKMRIETHIQICDPNQRKKATTNPRQSGSSSRKCMSKTNAIET
jgi:hypothetical protein